jgi:hypothetical protein
MLAMYVHAHSPAKSMTVRGVDTGREVVRLDDNLSVRKYTVHDFKTVLDGNPKVE